MIQIHTLPHILAVINVATVFVLLASYWFIQHGDRERHRAGMLTAAVLGVAFLAIYFTYHFNAGLAKFGGHGTVRPIYFTLLLVHILHGAGCGRAGAADVEAGPGRQPRGASQGCELGVAGLAVRVGFRRRGLCDGSSHLSLYGSVEEPMTGLSGTAAPRGLVSGATSMAKAGVPTEELRAWAALAIGSLALAGIMAVLVAVSRIPGIQAFSLWPLDFFPKGLVIHVIFSLVVWFLTVFALLVSMATSAGGGAGGPFCRAWRRWGDCRRIGVSLAVPHRVRSLERPSLNNYVPVIQHRAYYDGLAILALGIAMPVLRLLLNINTRWKEMPPLAFAMSVGSIIYLIALICFGIATYKSFGATPSKELNEVLFWGGGHILQFLFCLLLVTGWFVLSRLTLGEGVIGTDSLRAAVLILLAFSLPGLVFFYKFDMNGATFREAFSKLQFVMALPALMVGVPILFGIAREKEKGPLPWQNPRLRGAGFVHDRIRRWRPDGQSHLRLRHANARALSRRHYRGQPGRGWASLELLPAST